MRALVVFLSVGVALSVAFQFWGKYLIRYRLKGHSIHVTLCGTTVISIPYHTITETRVITLGESLTFLKALHIFNRYFGPRVVIRRSVEPDFIITPDDANACVHAIREHVSITKAPQSG